MGPQPWDLLAVSHIALSRGIFLEQSFKGTAEVLAWRNTERMGCHLPTKCNYINSETSIWCSVLKMKSPWIPESRDIYRNGPTDHHS